MSKTSTHKRFDPLTLDSVPEVGRLLRRLDLGELEDLDLTAYVGRNDNWAGTTSSGAQIFVKRVGGGAEDSLRQLRRVISFEMLADEPGLSELRGPRLLGHDTASRLVVFELLADASSGAELAGDDAFDEELSHQAGRMIGALHGCPPDTVPIAPDTSIPPLPAISRLDEISLPMFHAMSAAELELWGLVQSDTALTGALRSLRRLEAEAPQRLGHCDLRLDQFLLSDGVLHLIDWEEFRLADPARDVGSFTGEWLYRAILGIPGSSDNGELTHEEVLARGVSELERLRPGVERFWAGYRETCPDVDDGLAARATAFAGWHLLDRGLARATQNSRLNAVDRAALGIGRNALLEPEKFITVLGLGETS